MALETARVQRLAAALAGVKSELARIYAHWSVRGPSLESSTALAALAQEEGGHARVLAKLAGGETARCPLPCLAGTPVDWPELIGITGAAEAAVSAVLDHLLGSGAEDVRRNLMKMADEERYHADFFGGWERILAADGSGAGGSFRSAAKAARAEAETWLATLSLTFADSAAAPPRAALHASLPCPACGATDSEVLASFGSSLITAQLRCRACGSTFEGVRWAPTEVG